MAYIGTQPLAGQYRKLDDISSGFNGSTTSFTTSVGGTNVTAGSPQQLLVSLGGVIQQPTTDYTVNTNTITFTTAPGSGLSFFAVLMGDALNTSVPADGSITSAKLAGSLNVGLAAGSASTPSLFFSGDANTGIYSPGADQVAISTGGSGRLFVSSAGLVGVGTSAPGSTLHIEAAGNTVEQRIFTSDNVLNATASLTFGTTPGTRSKASIRLINSNTGNSSGDLALLTNDGSSLQNRLYITSAGNVGVGTTSPSQLFHVNGGYSLLNGLRISGADTSNSIYQSAAFGISSDNYITLSTGTGGPFERLRIDSSGRVGIGTSSVSANLHIKESAANTYGIIRVEGTGRGGEIDFYNGATAQGAIWGNSSTLNFGTGSSFTQAMIIDSSQRVGIGTTSPASIFHVSGSADQTYTFQTTTAGADNRINFRNSAGTDAGGIWYMHSGNHLLFNTGGSNGEKARIDGSGRLLVGTSSARSNVNLQAGDRTPFVQIETATDSYNNGISIINNSGSGFAPQISLGLSLSTSIGSNANVAPSTAAAIGMINFVGNDGDQFLTGARIEAITDAVTGNNDMPCRLVFSTTADGASSPTERMRIGNDGRTSAFSASSTNTLTLSSAAAAGTTFKFIEGAYGATGVNTGTESFRVYTNGDVQNTNNSYGSISDIKLKENIVDANSQWDDIKALQVRNYNFKEGQTHTQIGLIAQEVELVSPGLVTESTDRDAEGNDLGTVTKSVNYSVLYMKAVKALQEAMERIEQLETEKAEQQTVLDDLLARVAALEAA